MRRTNAACASDRAVACPRRQYSASGSQAAPPGSTGPASPVVMVRHRAGSRPQNGRHKGTGSTGPDTAAFRTDGSTKAAEKPVPGHASDGPRSVTQIAPPGNRTGDDRCGTPAARRRTRRPATRPDPQETQLGRVTVCDILQHWPEVDSSRRVREIFE